MKKKHARWRQGSDLDAGIAKNDKASCHIRHACQRKKRNTLSQLKLIIDMPLVGINTAQLRACGMHEYPSSLYHAWTKPDAHKEQHEDPI